MLRDRIKGQGLNLQKCYAFHKLKPLLVIRLTELKKRFFSLHDLFDTLIVGHFVKRVHYTFTLNTHVSIKYNIRLGKLVYENKRFRLVEIIQQNRLQF